MTNLITLTIPNDDHVALRAFGKALEEMALAHGAPLQLKLTNADVGKLEEAMNDEKPQFIQFYGRANRAVPEVDTTAQQVESLGAPTVQDLGGSEPVGDETKYPVDGTDSTGTPWDERIHSTSKALNSDGTWRLRRKPKDMDEDEWAAFVESVKAELTGFTETPPEAYETDDFIKPSGELQPPLYEIAPGHIGVMQPEPPVTPPGDDFHTDAGVVTEQTVAGIPPIPVPPVATGAMLDALAEIPVAPPIPHSIPVPAADEQAWDFPKLMKFLTEKHGRITVEQVNALLAVDGLAALTDLNAHPDKIGPFVARVKAHLGE